MKKVKKTLVLAFFSLVLILSFVLSAQEYYRSALSDLNTFSLNYIIGAKNNCKENETMHFQKPYLVSYLNYYKNIPSCSDKTKDLIKEAVEILDSAENECVAGNIARGKELYDESYSSKIKLIQSTFTDAHKEQIIMDRARALVRAIKAFYRTDSTPLVDKQLKKDPINIEFYVEYWPQKLYLLHHFHSFVPLSIDNNIRFEGEEVVENFRVLKSYLFGLIKEAAILNPNNTELVKIVTWANHTWIKCNEDDSVSGPIISDDQLLELNLN